MLLNSFGPPNHKTALFNLGLHLRSIPIRRRSYPCWMGARQDLRYSTTVERVIKNSSSRTSSNLIGRHYNLIGRLYEEHSIKCMREVLLFKDLVHVGKKGGQDGGIDIKGWLYLNRKSNLKIRPEHSQGGSEQQDSDGANDENQERYIKVIAQCKCSRAELRLVRELEGLVGASSSQKASSTSKPIMGILFSSQGFTTASLIQAEKSPFPLILIALEFPSALLSVSGDEPTGDVLGDEHGVLHPRCKIKHCYPNPIAVQLLRPFEFIRVSKLTTDGLPAQHSWVLVNEGLER